MNYLLLIIIIITIGILYRKYDDRINKLNSTDDYVYLRKYLLEDSIYDLGKSKKKKPIMWIHVPYEVNSRKWLNSYDNKV